MLMVSAHPGEHLAELLDDCGIEAAQLSEAIGVPLAEIEDVLAERADLSADFAVRLSKWTGQSPEFWVRLDAHHRAVRAMRAGRAAIDAIRPREDAA